MIAPVQRVRATAVVVLLGAWQALALSGLLYEDVVPRLEAVLAALWRVLISAPTYYHLAVTLWEVAAGFTIGLGAGVAIGILMGARPLLGRAAAPYVDALAAAPKIVFLPIVMLFFGTGIESKIALGALSGFFPVVINTSAGMRGIAPVLIRVGRSFKASGGQMVRLVYMPALLQPIATGMRLGLGVTIIGVLLAEIKLSNAGLGFLAIDHYSHFRIPDLYALLILIFALAIGANMLIGRLAGRDA
jgi:ABC-type nitrate/sulfonate/bicarbonate transport system permease component